MTGLLGGAWLAAFDCFISVVLLYGFRLHDPVTGWLGASFWKAWYSFGAINTGIIVSRGIGTVGLQIARSFGLLDV